MKTNDTDIFIASAMHYYTAGRYAVFASLNPTAANLLHHAVEMSLKGALSKAGMSLSDLRKLKHNLLKIWCAFTRSYQVDLSSFEPVIVDLNKYEEIRYPDLIVVQGMESEITRGKPPTSPGSGLPKYPLRLGDIDELLDRVFTVASISHKGYSNHIFKPEARKYLTEENDVAAWKK
jgi:hypothetical protein